MSLDRAERKLAAILAGDLVGYSRLIRADEAGTLSRLKTLRQEVIEPTIIKHRGRVVKTMGDGLLVEFPSVVDAVACAVAWQEGVAAREEAESEDRRLTFRIGVNLGDVIVEDGDLYGDGVNVAARLEGLAEPGGICISSDAHRQVRGKLTLDFEDMGEHELKNIAEPIRIFRVVLAHADAVRATASPRPLLPLPDKPSIAVLPFTNMSGDPEQDYFADGMVDEIITALSRSQWLFVIARNSSFTYKGRAVDVRQVARELGVRYVLEGSVRKAGSRVRISGRLIDAAKGTHLWADRFDGDLEDVFNLQDSVTASVVGAIEPKLKLAEVQRAKRKRPGSLTAYDYYLRALPHVYAMTLADNREALALLSDAIAHDPSYGPANACAAWCYEQRTTRGFPEAEPTDVERGVALARVAIDADREDGDVLAMAGFVLAMLGHDLEAGLAAVDRSLALNRNSAQALAFAGWVYSFVGRQEQALDCFETARRLSPSDPLTYTFLTGAAMAHFFMRHYEDAVAIALRSAQENGKWGPTFRYLAASYGQLGRQDEAGKAIARLLEIDTNVTVSHFRRRLPFGNDAQLELLIEGLRKAGLPK